MSPPQNRAFKTILKSLSISELQQKNGDQLVRRSLGGGGTQTPKACVSTGGAAEERKARIPACVSTGGAAEAENNIDRIRLGERAS